MLDYVAKARFFAKAIVVSACALTLSTDIAADTRTAVVELFTSQGCSSCPAADRILAQLSERRNLVALTFPVSYWDYLGWKDTLASSDNNERQRSYAEKHGHGRVYTPQAVINGIDPCVGNDLGKIENAIRETGKTIQSAGVELTAERKGDRLEVKAGEAPAGSPYRKAQIVAFAVAHSIEVPIQRGENGGMTVTYSNVVRNTAIAGTWHGRAASYELRLDRVMPKDANFLVVLLQDDETGAILEVVQTPDLGGTRVKT